jgi:hypothetical protein
VDVFAIDFMAPKAVVGQADYLVQHYGSRFALALAIDRFDRPAPGSANGCHLAIMTFSRGRVSVSFNALYLW